MVATGQQADERQGLQPLLFSTVDSVIETGDSEHTFQKAIMEQGRGQVGI
ncbi:hypothetical protein YC2023_023788 [Brassica napus]